MDIEQLRTFCQLAADENYRVAAEHLFITQSALSKKIQRLEGYIGIALFERGRQGARLTQAGMTLLPEAQRMVADFDAFDALTRLVAEGTAGNINIGFGISSYHLAPQLIAQFKQHFANIHITLNDTPSQHQTDALLRNELHLSFNRLPVDAPLKGVKLSTDHLVIAIHQSHKFEIAELWSSLQNIDYLRLNPARGQRLNQQITATLIEHDQQLHPVQQADDIQTLLALVSANLGFTIVPASVKYIANDSVKFIPLGGTSSQWDVGMIWNQNTECPARDRFVDFITNSDVND